MSNDTQQTVFWPGVTWCGGRGGVYWVYIRRGRWLRGRRCDRWSVVCRRHPAPSVPPRGAASNHQRHARSPQHQLPPTTCRTFNTRARSLEVAPTRHHMSTTIEATPTRHPSHDRLVQSWRLSAFVWDRTQLIAGCSEAAAAVASFMSKLQIADFAPN